MGISVLLLIALLHLVTSNQNCSKLEIFKGADKEQNVKCIEYGTNVCTGGVRGSLPGNLSAGASVSKPRNFQITLFRRNYTGTTYEMPGMTFRWKVPADGISRQHLKGFYLHLQLIGSAKVICRVFDLRNFDMTTSASFEMEYELYPFNKEETYNVKLFSLPPPSRQEEIEGTMHESYIASVTAPRNYAKVPAVYPATWKTWIIVKQHPAESKIEIKFGYPEDRAWFNKFFLQLIEDDKEVLTHDYTRRASESEGVYNFSSVASGTYRIQIQPTDEFFGQHGKCQCWKKSDLFAQACDNCVMTTTQYFNFTSSSSGDLQVGQSKDPQGSGSSSIIVPAIVVPLVVLVVGAVIVVGIYRWKKSVNSREAGQDLDHNKNNRKPFTDVFSKFGKQDVFVPDLTETKKPEISRKSVLLLASEDHKYFSQALHSFAAFLRLHCQCDVFFAPQQLSDVRKTANSYCWLSGKIDQADVIIIVTSEAACRLYRAFQNGQLYKEADLGPEGDLFTPGIKHICGKISRSEDVSKVMMVRFGHTSAEHRLPISALPPSFYVLPDRLKSCLLHIHGLDENSTNLMNVNLPLQGNVKDLQGGGEWLNAVSESLAFERQHPGWFEEKFGKPIDMCKEDKPVYDTQVSGLSEESGFFEGRNSGSIQRRLSSVSTHAGEGPGSCVSDGVENPSFVFSKSDFFAPSEFEQQSAYTVPYSAYTAAERPPEVDRGSTISDQFRMVNERYEQDRMEEQQGPESIPLEKRSAISDQSGYPQAYQNLAYPQSDACCIGIQHLEGETDGDCVSVSSAQSV